MEQTEVVLLKKRSSDAYNPDCWNGVGGKIEDGETSDHAISRETQEETALIIAPTQWTCWGCISDGATYHVDVFTAIERLDLLTTPTDECVKVFNRSSIQNEKLAYGVSDVLTPWVNGQVIA